MCVEALSHTLCNCRRSKNVRLHNEKIDVNAVFKWVCMTAICARALSNESSADVRLTARGWSPCLSVFPDTFHLSTHFQAQCAALSIAQSACSAHLPPCGSPPLPPKRTHTPRLCWQISYTPLSPRLHTNTQRPTCLKSKTGCSLKIRDRYLLPIVVSLTTLSCIFPTLLPVSPTGVTFNPPMTPHSPHKSKDSLRREAEAITELC